MQRILDRIGHWINDFFNSLFTVAGNGGISLVLSILIVVVVAAVIALLVVHLVRNHAPRLAEASGSGSLRALSATDWLVRATAAEESGDFAEALRCRYRASVAMLGAGKLIEEIPGGTAGEYRVQLARTAPGIYPDFAELAGSFEAAWYAGISMGVAEADQSRARCEAISASLGLR